MMMMVGRCRLAVQNADLSRRLISLCVYFWHRSGRDAPDLLCATTREARARGSALISLSLKRRRKSGPPPPNPHTLQVHARFSSNAYFTSCQTKKCTNKKICTLLFIKRACAPRAKIPPKLVQKKLINTSAKACHMRTKIEFANMVFTHSVHLLTDPATSWEEPVSVCVRARASVCVFPPPGLFTYITDLPVSWRATQVVGWCMHALAILLLLLLLLPLPLPRLLSSSTPPPPRAPPATVSGTFG